MQTNNVPHWTEDEKTGEILCANCGEPTDKRDSGCLKCHHAGYSVRSPKPMPKLGQGGRLVRR